MSQKSIVIDAILAEVNIPQDVLPGYTKWLKKRSTGQLYGMLGEFRVINKSLKSKNRPLKRR